MILVSLIFVKIKPEEFSKSEDSAASTYILGRGPNRVVVELDVFNAVSLRRDTICGAYAREFHIATSQRLRTLNQPCISFRAYSISLLTPRKLHDIILLLENTVQFSLCS
jgi:hypothetical protein